MTYEKELAEALHEVQGGALASWRGRAPLIAAALAERGFRLVSEDSLDAAWAEAEAALGDHGLWLIQGVQLVDVSDSDDIYDERLEWEAEAVDHQRGGQPYNVTALGATPTAALIALAAKLREVK